MIRTATIAAAALLAMVAPAVADAARPTPQQKLDRLLAGRVAGEPVSCIQLWPQNKSTIISGQTIVYDVGPTRYVAKWNRDCRELRDQRTLITRVPNNRLCRGDSAEVFDYVTRVGFGACIFDGFVPYSRPKKNG